MLKSLKDFFKNELLLSTSKKDTADQEHSLQQVCALLLMEVSNADFEQSAIEKDKIKKVLKSLFSLSESELTSLYEYSAKASADTTSVHPFTSMLNDHYDYEQKLHLLKLMWKVAYVDDNLDKHEEAVIRKVADLLYISHSDFIKMKHVATEESK
jgi:uncharacterized tellurite resistance protein B-like protein